jgi:hypothetical protein
MKVCASVIIDEHVYVSCSEETVAEPKAVQDDGELVSVAPQSWY